jgi:hypothetical protein
MLGRRMGIAISCHFLKTTTAFRGLHFLDRIS